jgi:UDP-glucose 4-epimerase
MSDLIWVTGARGFIGSHVARDLARQGAVVCGVGHGLWPNHEAAKWGLSEWINGDVSASNLGALAAIRGNPALVIHLAGGSSVGAALAQPREDFRRTVESTAELLEWLRQEAPQARVVAVSSAAVYGDGHARPIAESAALNPYSPYGHHKAAMESLCQSYAASYGLRVVIARLFSVYGAGLRKQLLWDLCVKLAHPSADVTLGGTGGETRDWVHVEDIASILPALAVQASRQVPVFNVGSGNPVSVNQIASLVAHNWLEQGGRSIVPRFTGQGRAGDPQYLVASCSKLMACGLSAARPIEHGIGEYVKWFRSHPEVIS